MKQPYTDEEAEQLGSPAAFEAIDKLYDNLYDYLEGGGER